MVKCVMGDLVPEFCVTWKKFPTPRSVIMCLAIAWFANGWLQVGLDRVIKEVSAGAVLSANNVKTIVYLN